MAVAFTTGFYQPQSFSFFRYQTFGTGRYGDLMATVAAILFDRESLSDTLDADPMHGSLREPLIKVIALMRNFEYATHGFTAENNFVTLGNLESKIGKHIT